LEDRKKCRDAGMDDFLVKPLKRGELEAALQRWVKKTTPPSQEAA